MIAEEEPQLAPPGAGLPMHELLVGRWIFRRGARRSGTADSAAMFTRGKVRILEHARNCGVERGGRRVLIPRLRGLEDSSRFWSVWMTVEHLRIVNEAVAGTIELLRSGRTPDRVATTAGVKPAAGVGSEVVPLFERSCDAVELSVEGGGDLRTAARHAHPWFGPLDAAEWHYMAGFHMRLHLRQIEEILRRL